MSGWHPCIISSQGNHLSDPIQARSRTDSCGVSFQPGYHWREESFSVDEPAITCLSRRRRAVFPPLYILYTSSLPSFLQLEARRLSPYRASRAPALAGKVDGTRWRRCRRRVVVLVHPRDEVVWCLGFRVQRVGEEEGDVLAEGGVCEEGRAAAWDGEGDGCWCLGRHFCGCVWKRGETRISWDFWNVLGEALRELVRQAEIRVSRIFSTCGQSGGYSPKVVPDSDASCSRWYES